jgi:hypothetical protein
MCQRMEAIVATTKEKRARSNRGPNAHRLQSPARNEPMIDTLTLQNGKAILTTEEGRHIERDEAQLVDMIRQELVPPLNGVAMPDGIKFLEWRAPFLLVVHQLPPHVRQFRWIANDSREKFGPGTKYRKVRLSIPYAITFALYYERGSALALGGANELYFRNEPLRSRQDRLGYAALLNISRIRTPRRERAWICTQYLRHSKGGDWTVQLAALLDHTFNGGFNLSSEHHEGASWYGESSGVHADLHPVEKWEAATAANEAFALGVPWKPAALSVGQLMDCMLEEAQAGLHAGGLAHLLGAAAKKPMSVVGRFLSYAAKAN